MQKMNELLLRISLEMIIIKEEQNRINAIGD